ncbi:unnamed protein product [Phyllotreta striolata]|uniref:Uncharacterized protein n=1 Tax=Phyllotreta striolata TaxID=444603 RepID=A0A9N9XKC2_PHYSR|nr:unnamed protein product [Phyllotreta striolata]
MGCTASKTSVVEPLDGSHSNGHLQLKTVPVSPKQQDVLPPLEAEDLQEELLLENSSVNNMHKGTNGMSFDIAFEENEEEENPKKLPPRRILERLDGPPPTPSLQQLQDKLEEADIRRQQILAQRIQSAKRHPFMKKLHSGSSADDEEDDGFLKIPKEINGSVTSYKISDT